jgi:hypothetical protein
VYTKIIRIKSFGTIILHVILHERETLSLTLREEYKLNVLENVALRNIFGPRRKKGTGDRRKLHSEELHDLYSQLLLDGKLRKHLGLMGGI